MESRALELLKKLVNTPGPSGFEEQARRVWVEAVRPYCDQHLTDVHGTEIATLRGKSQRTAIMLLGHIDQLGLIVRYIDEKGFLYFAPIGGVDVDTVISQPVRVMGPKGTIPGIVGKIAFHLQDPEDRKKKLQLHELWIDIGATSREEAQEYAPIGTPVAVGEGVTELLNGRIAGRIDNRFGAFVVAEVLRRLHGRREELFPTVHAVASVQEETSGRFTGASTAGYRLMPSAAIAVDVNHSMDIPGADKRRAGDAAMGKGAILTVGVSSSNKLAAAIRKAAEQAGMSIQLEYENGRHGTDADAMPVTRTGIPSVSLGNALRYMHNTVEMADLGDIEAVVDVLEAFLLSISQDVDYTA